jgi:hypothetical protein
MVNSPLISRSKSEYKKLFTEAEKDNYLAELTFEVKPAQGR